MPKPTIYFTVSMWNRMEHFKALLEDLKKIHQQDPDIVLHVADFYTVPKKEILDLLAPLPFHSKLLQLQGEFCNGLGHNECIRHIHDDEALVAVIAVDLKMPPDITTDIRKNAVPGKCFYGPMIRYECQDGSTRKCTAAYALIAAARADLRKAGKLAENMMWGGDRREGGEDTRLMHQLKNHAKLRQRRPVHAGLICRWHTRNVDQKFYQSWKRYNQMPHWNMTDDEGNVVGRE
jgi:hypothetical protein